MRNRIADAMAELWQKNIVCNYVIAVNGKELILNSTYALDAYMEAYSLSKNVDVVKCFMAPTGKKAANPVFVIEDGKVFLSGMLICNIGFEKGIKELYSTYLKVASRERMQVIEYVGVIKKNGDL